MRPNDISSSDFPQVVPITSPKVKDWTGRVFGRLMVLGFAGPDHRWRSQWVCRCECGNVVTIKASYLKHGDTQSCGCLHSEMTANRNRKHGLSDMPEYPIYKGIIARCENQNLTCYKNYGGRGIVVCEHWRQDFANFLHDIGRRPTKRHSVDRIDNDGNYSCGHCEQCLREGWTANCRWATRREQANNTRFNRVLEYDGKTMTMSIWARQMGLTPDQVQSRLSRGWTVERALTQPLRAPRPYRR